MENWYTSKMKLEQLELERLIENSYSIKRKYNKIGCWLFAYPTDFDHRKGTFSGIFSF